MSTLDNLSDIVTIGAVGMMASYFCSECGKNHHKSSKVGKQHRKYAKKKKGGKK